MRREVSLLLLLFAVIGCQLLAQENGTPGAVRVCVAPMREGGAGHVTLTDRSHALTAQLNRLGSKKSRKNEYHSNRLPRAHQ